LKPQFIFYVFVMQANHMKNDKEKYISICKRSN